MINKLIDTISQRIKNVTSNYLINNGWYNKPNYNNTISHPLLKSKQIDNFFCHKKTLGMPDGIPSHRFIMFFENGKYHLADFANDTITTIKSQYQLNKLLK